MFRFVKFLLEDERHRRPDPGGGSVALLAKNRVHIHNGGKRHPQPPPDMRVIGLQAEADFEDGG